MCTAMTLKAADGSVLAARTMDFSYPLDPRRVCREAGSTWNSGAETGAFTVRYSFCGIGQNAGAEGDEVLFADGVNERGFCVMALYFPGYANYDTNERTPEQHVNCNIYIKDMDRQDGETNPGTDTVASYEVVPYLLGMCANVRQAVFVFQNLQIVGVTDAVTGIAAPLHWFLADCSGACVTVEKTASGLHVYRNAIGVLTNSPDFTWHMTNLRNYVGIEPYRPEHAYWDGVELAPLGQGDGTRGLPGNFTPPSRFVRTAWLKSHTTPGADFEESMMHARCILGNVSIPHGCVVTERGTVDYTQYTVFFDLEQGDCVLEKNQY